MITVTVFGTTPLCVKCQEAAKRAQKVVEKYAGRVEVVKRDAISEEGQKLGIMFTPVVMINDKIIASGKVISEGELDGAIKKELEG